jgi:uncharacterized membrane protein
MRETAFSFLDDQERERVESAVAEAEQMTSAEFVCAVATESGRYDRAESFIGFAFAVVLLSAANLVTWQLSRSGDWGRAPSPPFLVQLLMVSLGFVLGTTLASYWHGLRRLAVSSREMTAETAKAASHVFTDHGVGHLDNRGGVLIYVSLPPRWHLIERRTACVNWPVGPRGVPDRVPDVAPARTRFPPSRRHLPFA